MVFFGEDTEGMQDIKDHFGSLEECQCCPNLNKSICYYALTGIPGKCEHFYLNDSSFNALEMLASFDDSLMLE